MIQPEISENFPSLREEHVSAVLVFALESNESIKALLVKHKTSIKEFISSEDYGLLELY